jgi:hypothetical protein
VTRDVLRFELYLMSRMRGTAAVEAALGRLGVDAEAMYEAAALVVSDGLERPGHSIEPYLDLIGAPIEVSADPGIDPAGAFAGSRRYRFRLPLWEPHDFIVRAHPAGWAWGPEFVARRGAAIDLLGHPADLRPWSAVESEVVAAFGTPASEEAWEASKDVVYWPHADAIVLSFDFSLLQQVRSG